MTKIKRFEELHAWQKARELVREIYRICQNSGLSSDFGLRNQLQRAAVSAMSNIAEGFGRNSDRDFAHFLDLSRGSAIEVQSLLYVAKDVQYLTDPDFSHLYHLADETLALVGGLTLYLRKSQP